MAISSLSPLSTGAVPSWYAATATPYAPFAALPESTTCDICIVGGGYTGLSAAIELGKKGYDVVLLEARTIGFGASGRNGGQMVRGFNKSPKELEKRFGRRKAEILWNIDNEGISLIKERIAEFSIPCDFVPGNIVAAIKPRQMKEREEELAEWADFGYTGARMLDREALYGLVRSRRYLGGSIDPECGHFHPLNYAIGLAAAAKKLGVRLHEHSPAASVTQQGERVTVRTAGGAEVTARFALMACNAYLGALDKSLARKIIAANSYIIATEPLGRDVAEKLISQNHAVEDANWVLDYFRRTPDHRLLFGGSLSYSGIDFPGQKQLLHAKMTKVFPELENIKVDYCWGGSIALTLSRLPALGKLDRNIFYAEGYSGHGVILSGMAGRVMAEAVAGTAERFDVMAGIPHMPFPGGDAFRRPALVLGMLWYRMRDLWF